MSIILLCVFGHGKLWWRLARSGSRNFGAVETWLGKWVWTTWVSHTRRTLTVPGALILQPFALEAEVMAFRRKRTSLCCSMKTARTQKMCLEDKYARRLWLLTSKALNVGWCSKTENAKSPLEGFCKTPRPAGPADLSFSQLNEGQSPCAILHLKIKASALLLWDTALWTLTMKEVNVCSVPELSFSFDVFSLVNSIFLVKLHLSMCTHPALQTDAVIDYIGKGKENQEK